MAREWNVPGDFLSINAALQTAHDHDTIRVGPGLYTTATEKGPIVITKIVQLLGAQAGVDARTRAGTPSLESIIEIVDGSGSIQLNQDHVVVDGFTIQNNTAGFGIAACPSPRVSGFSIFNNIINNNQGGLSIDSNTTSISNSTFSQIRYNSFRANNPQGNAIYSGNGTMNVIIDKNKFTGHSTACINLAAGTQNPPPLVIPEQRNIVISNNEMENDSSIALANTNNIKIIDNLMIQSQGSAIFIAGGNNGTDIENNVLHDSISNGIYVNTLFFAGANKNIRAKKNSIQGNASAGILVDSGAYLEAARKLDATNNWWGSTTGATNQANPEGTGDAVIDENEVIFTPFLTSDPLGALTYDQLLASSQAALQASKAAVAATQHQLMIRQQELEAAGTELLAREHNLAASQAQITASQAQLTATQNELTAVQSQLLASKQKLTAYQLQLATVQTIPSEVSTAQSTATTVSDVRKTKKLIIRRLHAAVSEANESKQLIKTNKIKNAEQQLNNTLRQLRRAIRSAADL